MTKPQAIQEIEDLIDRFWRELSTAQALDVLDEMADRAQTAATARREELDLAELNEEAES